MAARPNAHNLRCLFRVVYMLPEPFELLSRDTATFEYLYQQCCNDIVQERYQPEIKYEMALRLSALRIFEHSVGNGFMDTNKRGKVNLKRLEAETGLDHFVPASLYHSMKRKELLRVLAHSMKLNAATLSDPKSSMTPLHCKLQFLKILSDLPCYGGKTYFNSFNSNSKAQFTTQNKQDLNVSEKSEKEQTNNTYENGSFELVNIVDNAESLENDSKLEGTTEKEEAKSRAYLPTHRHLVKQSMGNHSPLANESTVLLSPKYGLSFLSNATPLTPISVIRVEEVSTIRVTPSENSGNEVNIDIYGRPVSGSAAPAVLLNMHPITDKSLKSCSLKEPIMQLSFETADAQEFVLLIKGYHQLLGETLNSKHNNGGCNNLSSMNGSLSNRFTGKTFNSTLQIIWECSNDEWWNDGGKYKNFAKQIKLFYLY